MNRLYSYLSTIVVVFLATSAMGAGGDKGGCNLQGSWMGTGTTKLIVSYDGQSLSTGTIKEELLGFDPTLGGAFPTAVEVTGTRGVWERTGGHTFVYTQIASALDAAGNIVYIAKNSGNKTLSEDCNLMTVESSLEFFAPEVDPFDGEPMFCVPLDTIYARRMRVDPPCSLE